MIPTAIVTRAIRWRGRPLFPAGTLVELLDMSKAGSWLILGTDPDGIDRAAWVRPSWVLPDPQPHLTMEDA
jgi:hypothetical protein